MQKKKLVTINFGMLCCWDDDVKIAKSKQERTSSRRPRLFSRCTGYSCFDFLFL